MDDSLVISFQKGSKFFIPPKAINLFPARRPEILKKPFHCGLTFGLEDVEALIEVPSLELTKSLQKGSEENLCQIARRWKKRELSNGQNEFVAIPPGRKPILEALSMANAVPKFCSVDGGFNSGSAFANGVQVGL